MPEHTRSLRVSFGETDAAAIVYYPNYLRWFDQGTHDLFRELGYSSSRLLRQGITIAVIEAHARFHASLLFEDEVTLTSRIVEVRNRAFRVDHAVRRGETLVCEGYEVRMWVRLDSVGGGVRPEALPDDVRAAIAGT